MIQWRNANSEKFVSDLVKSDLKTNMTFPVFQIIKPIKKQRKRKQVS